jgi:hypothetical protein
MFNHGFVTFGNMMQGSMVVSGGRLESADGPLRPPSHPNKGGIFHRKPVFLRSSKEKGMNGNGIYSFRKIDF